MLQTLKRKWRLFRLHQRAWMLQGQVDHAEELLQTYSTLQQNCIMELRSVKRRIILLESPEVLLQREVME